MNTKNIFIGRVYYYISSWLKGNNQEPHYIPIVSNLYHFLVIIVPVLKKKIAIKKQVIFM